MCMPRRAVPVPQELGEKFAVQGTVDPTFLNKLYTITDYINQSASELTCWLAAEVVVVGGFVVWWWSAFGEKKGGTHRQRSR